MVTPEPSKSPSPLLTSTDLPHAVAKFKFQAESAKELSFQKVSHIMLLLCHHYPPSSRVTYYSLVKEWMTTGIEVIMGRE